MNKRKFLSLFLLLPLTGCIHWPGIDNKKKHSLIKKEEFKEGDNVLVITPLQEGRNFDFGVGKVWPCNCGNGVIHPLGTITIGFERESRHTLFGHYKPEQLVKL